MIKIRRQNSGRQADPRTPSVTPVAAPRLAKPAALDDKQLKQVAGGSTGTQAPKGTW
jgi:hypothetical protein